ncbi:MAG: pyruvate kinase [Calditrichia bacterium]
MRHTKIVCTIGPVSEQPENLEKLILAGMDVARLNFSHSSLHDHSQRILNIRELSLKLGKPIAILQDLSGPKIRINDIEDNKVILHKGQEFTLYGDGRTGNGSCASINYPSILHNIKKGDTILMADGTIVMKVIKAEKERAVCKVLAGDMLSSHKGVNFPETPLDIPALTEKDKKDLQFGIEHGVDLIALSFVKHAGDILDVKKILQEHDAFIPVIAKIEKADAVKNIKSILEVADGIMVARGDLGVEIDIAQVPLVQKKVIEAARKLGKPVITATQMLKSMVDSPMPTRAEATDVANAILDGTDAVMLSEETAIGNFFDSAVEFMNRIAIATEKNLAPQNEKLSRELHSIPDAISHSAFQMAKELNAKLIITPTQSGSTANKVARFRPSQPVIAVTPNVSTLMRLKLTWGVFPYLIHEMNSIPDIIDQTIKLLKKDKWVKKGDIVVVTAGTPFSQAGTTNLIKAIVVN